MIIGKKSAWWNRKLKGWWLLGGPIGFVATLLIAYRIALWLLISLIAFGCLFAIIFRLARKDGEI